jgi:hypothetical protein
VGELAVTKLVRDAEALGALVIDASRKADDADVARANEASVGAGCEEAG